MPLHFPWLLTIPPFACVAVACNVIHSNEPVCDVSTKTVVNCISEYKSIVQMIFEVGEHISIIFLIQQQHKCGTKLEEVF